MALMQNVRSPEVCLPYEKATLFQLFLSQYISHGFTPKFCSFHFLLFMLNTHP